MIKIQILTNKNSWFFNNQNKIPNKYKKYIKKNLLTSHLNIKKNYDITVIISYYKIIPEKFLLHSKHNLVVHESNLPKGRGFSPLIKQILNGKTKIVITLFECSKNMDEGKIILKKFFYFKPTLIYDEIKEKQLKSAFFLLDLFLKKYKIKKNIKTYNQTGQPTYYKKIKTSFNELNVNKTIKSQFNKLRTRDNENFPSFFFYKKRKYIIKIN